MLSLANAYGFARFARGLPAFVRTPISVAEARAHIEEGMKRREAAFLEKVERAVFASSRSPYRALLRAAGCELDDVRRLVREEGVEGALQKLREGGVYVTLEEFKGMRPAVRGSRTFRFAASDFDNPLITPHFQATSGGTRGRPTRILVDLEHIAQSAPHWALWFAAHDWLSRPVVFWTPTHSGIANRQLICAKFGKPFVKWFGTISMGTLTQRMISAAVHHVVRRATGLSAPELVPLSEAWKVGEYLARMVGEGRKPCVVTSPSEAIKACLAMGERGISLRGVTFLLGAEPLTQARRDTIEASGARAVPTYGFSEGGNVGSQCPNPSAADDVHVSRDAYAVIQKGTSALLLTALRAAAPKILLNTEIGDSAVLETRRCGCLFDEVGYFQHLHTIRSFEKLTGIGVTIVGADVFRVLEVVLPRRFGGALTDYQLVEEQDAQGLPRYTLRVSPEVGTLDEAALRAVFLGALGKMRGHYRFMVDLWAREGILHVARERPVPTARGKVLPVRTLGLR
jgi:hypothetical protein